MQLPVLELTREEQARLELGRTAVTPAVQRALTLAFLAFLASMLVLQAIAGARRLGPEERWTAAIPPGLRLDRLLPGPAEIRALRDLRGALALLPSVDELQRFEESLEEQSPLRTALLPPIQAFLTGALGVGNEEAVVGASGWLFYRPDVDTVTGEPFLDPERHARLWRQEGRRAGGPRHDPVAAILDFHAQLARRGIALVVLPVPGKPEIQPERLVAGVRPARPLHNPSFEEFLARLHEHGVLVLDPSAALWAVARKERAAYLATDTHWTPQAMRVVARELAEFLVARGLVERGTPGTFAADTLELRAPGDVATMLRLPPGSALFAPELLRLEPVHDARGEQWAPRAGSPVLLLGDSFTNVFSLGAMGLGAGGGLAEHLSLALELPLDRIARNGGGALATRAALAAELRRGESADRLARTRVVVFQFAARELLFGDWRLVPLPARPSGSAPLASAAAARVSATIAAIRRPPDPSSVPYADAVVALHLRAVAARDGTAFPEEVVAYALALEERRWTPFAELEPDARVELELVAWDEVRAAYDGLNRIELDDPDFALIDLPLYWATLPAPGERSAR
jgi:alginate O-acetyltransferase complex protein AlgJ